jgi:hypothetical protein
MFGAGLLTAPPPDLFGAGLLTAPLPDLFGAGLLTAPLPDRRSPEGGGQETCPQRGEIVVWRR